MSGLLFAFCTSETENESEVEGERQIQEDIKVAVFVFYCRVISDYRFSGLKRYTLLSSFSTVSVDLVSILFYFRLGGVHMLVC